MTEYKRFELLDGVFLTAVRTDACAVSCMSMTLLTQLTRETAALNAVLPAVLRRGSSRLPDNAAIDAALAEMGGAEILPTVRKLGELQAVGLLATFPHTAFQRMAQELTVMLLAPNTRGGLLRPDWVKAEAAALTERISSAQEDAPDHARRRLIEEMCCCEDFALSEFGDAESAESIFYQKLTRHYHDLLQKSPLEIFYLGTEAPRSVAQVLAELLVTMPRGEPDDELGTDVRMNSLESAPRTVRESLPEQAEASIAVGWRLGDQMEDPDPAALRMLEACLRQMLKAALAPETRVSLDLHKGLLLLDAPLRTTAETALEIIHAQLGLLAAEALPEETRSAALAESEAQLLTAAQDAAKAERFWIERAPLGLLYSPEELLGLLQEVTPADIAASARSLECDMVYVCTPEPDDEIETTEA